MTTLYEAAQQALEALDKLYLPGELDRVNAAITALRAALKQEAEATAWLAERKNHWRKEREKAQAAKDQDPELSAALGWPGGISDPVLDRTQLLQMVAVLRVSAQQALEALEYAQQDRECPSTTRQAITALRAALAQEQADPCPNCASLEAQNTELDRKLAEMEQTEPVAWLQPKTVDAHSRPDLGYETCSKDDYGAFPVHTAPPRRTMVSLTEEEIDNICRQAHGGADPQEWSRNFARAVEKASWEKNHG